VSLYYAILNKQSGGRPQKRSAETESISGGTEADVAGTEGKMGEPAQATAVNDEQKYLGGNSG